MLGDFAARNLFTNKLIIPLGRLLRRLATAFGTALTFKILRVYRAWDDGTAKYPQGTLHRALHPDLSTDLNPSPFAISQFLIFIFQFLRQTNRTPPSACA